MELDQLKSKYYKLVLKNSKNFNLRHKLMMKIRELEGYNN